ncbi:hypothetical protein FDA94_28635 [Herbidospora galbida]|uniref:Uncharacterized protein n=1 Tax=Herbidospora galbida TaxID=2575442 RepID=A0A4U3M8M6_9ACTN|nr:hypothetical protein [Herbidospora galbida]TKK84599.1 hypothetical protein FDA94_28635 [Herbidospora galbida]
MTEYTSQSSANHAAFTALINEYLPEYRALYQKYRAAGHSYSLASWKARSALRDKYPNDFQRELDKRWVTRAKRPYAKKPDPVLVTVYEIIESGRPLPEHLLPKTAERAKNLALRVLAYALPEDYKVFYGEQLDEYVSKRPDRTRQQLSANARAKALTLLRASNLALYRKYYEAVAQKIPPALQFYDEHVEIMADDVNSGMSQAEAAERWGIHPSDVSKFLRNGSAAKRYLAS